MIKSYCDETFNFINNNSSRQDLYKDKLNMLLKNINEYMKHYNGNKNNKNLINLNYLIIIKKNNLNSNINNIKINDENKNNRINTFRSTNFNNKTMFNNYSKFGGIINRYNY